ncbi:MAG TPA: hypothetical protein VFS97_15230 [Nitrososphaeraceae archaeon]|nr:hypothetical protein [Nitrososphaeraceae archaeon]
MPNCDETNRNDSKFCSKCKYVLHYDAYNEKIEEAEHTKKELEEMKEKINSIEKQASKRQEDLVNALFLTVDPDAMKKLDEKYGPFIQQVFSDPPT